MKTGQSRQLFIQMIQAVNEQMKSDFRFMGTGGHYTQDQKTFATDKIGEYGVRAIARILELPRRTLQRWCRAYGVYVERCPDWVSGWVERRRKRRKFWERRGYNYPAPGARG